MTNEHTQNNHHRVNRIQLDPRFLPCKHEKPEYNVEKMLEEYSSKWTKK